VLSRAVEDVTRAAYDCVAGSVAQLLPDMSFEAPLDLAVLDEFVRCVLAAPDGLVLDAGCGTGRVSDYLSKAGIDSVGLDLSMAMLLEARPTAARRLVQATIRKLPLRTGSVAGVLAWYSIIHTSPGDLDEAIAEFARVLRPGGPLLVAFQEGEGETLRRDSAYGHAVDVVNVRHRFEDVSRLLVQHGFQPLAAVRRAARPIESAAQGFLLVEAGATSTITKHGREVADKTSIRKMIEEGRR
jgi:ubiquinone/menaquinone biosynthesis C-methylase UbiE